jgi:uncharacterized membrane protein
MVMSTHPLPTIPDTGRSSRAYLFPVVSGLVVLLFLAAPWSLEHKAHAALHGLCAQRPSHSFWLGDHRLPFDARMTGIYSGFLVSAVYLGWHGRFRAAALPSFTSLAVLIGFVGIMGIDGFNSLFLDMGWRYGYEPDNRLRLVTGLMTGVGLAAAIFILFGMALWRRPRLDQKVITSPWEPFLLLALQLPLVLVILSGEGWLYGPVALLLVGTATAVVSSLALVVIVMLRYADNSFERVEQLQGYAVVALLVGIAVMAAIGGGRYALEALTNAPPVL